MLMNLSSNIRENNMPTVILLTMQKCMRNGFLNSDLIKLK